MVPEIYGKASNLGILNFHTFKEIRGMTVCE